MFLCNHAFGAVPAQEHFKKEGTNGRQRQLGVRHKRNPVGSNSKSVRVGEPVPLVPRAFLMTISTRAPLTPSSLEKFDKDCI